MRRHPFEIQLVHVQRRESPPFGTRAGMEMWVAANSAADDIEFPSVPTFFLDSHIAAGGDPLSIHISEGDRNEILQFSLDGALVRIIRRKTDPVRVTDRTHGAWMEAMYAFGEMMGEPVPPGIFDGMSRKETYPPVAGTTCPAGWMRRCS